MTPIDITMSSLPTIPHSPLAPLSPGGISMLTIKSDTAIYPLQMARPGDLEGQNHSQTVLSWWATVEDHFWAAFPLVLHVAGLAALVGALFQLNEPYLSLSEVGGTGRLDYGVLGEPFSLQVAALNSRSDGDMASGSCAIAPGTTLRICAPRLLQADFLPSLLLVSSTVPGFALFQLPIKSSQTPAVFISSLVVLFTSLLFILPAWTAVYLPRAPLPAPLARFNKRFTKELYFIGGALAFASFVLTLTIGIGCKELLLAAMENYEASSLFELNRGTVGNLWIPEIGPGFHLVWAASSFSAMVALGVNVALHNRLDERAARGGRLENRAW